MVADQDYHSRAGTRWRRITAMGAALLVLCIMGCSSRRAVEPAELLIGKSVPSFVGEALDGRRVTFPAEVTGPERSPSLLLVAYVQEAQFDVDRWVLGALQAKAPVRILELPTIEGLAARLAKGFINRGMQQGIPQQDWPAVVTVYDDAKVLASFVGGIPGNNACALLVDDAGIVRWVSREGYSPRELLKMVAEVQKLGGESGAVAGGS